MAHLHHSWQGYRETAAAVGREANALGDIERMSRGFSVPVRRSVQEAARTYANLVIDVEWPAMEHGQSSEQAHAILVELWNSYTDMPASDRAHQIYGASIVRLNELSTNRRLRLLSSANSVPILMWGLLALDAVALVLLSLVLDIPRRGMHVLLIALMTATMVSSLFLVAVLDGPFDGQMRVSPEPFRFVLESLQNLER